MSWIRAQKRGGRHVIGYRDHNGRVRSLAAFAHRGLTQQLQRRLDVLVEHASMGEPPPAEIARWFREQCPPRILATLADAGLLSAAVSASSRPVRDHIADWRSDLEARASRQHAGTRAAQAQRVLDEAGAVAFADIDASRVGAVLADWKRRGELAQTTIWKHRQAVRSFTAWMLRHGRADRDPLAHLTRVVVTERRIVRRVLTLDDFRALLAAAAGGPPIKTERGRITGPERFLLYRVAAETGLRIGELQQIRRSWMRLEDQTPVIEAPASATKNRRAARVVVRPSTARRLSERTALLAPSAYVFRCTRQDSATIIRADLEAAGLPFEDDRGRRFDFHALRGQFISMLVAAGVNPKVVQELARHSDIRLTMDVYARTLAPDEAGALDRLPDLDVSSVAAESASGVA